MNISKLRLPLLISTFFIALIILPNSGWAQDPSSINFLNTTRVLMNPSDYEEEMGDMADDLEDIDADIKETTELLDVLDNPRLGPRILSDKEGKEIDRLNERLKKDKKEKAELEADLEKMQAEYVALKKERGEAQDAQYSDPAIKASSKWRLGLGILNLNFDGLNDPRDKSVDRSDPNTLKGVGADDSKLGGEAIIRYRSPNSKLYLEGGILGASGFGASEYFREGMIDIDVMREMDFIGFKAGGGFTVPIIKDRLWFFNAGAGGIATKTTTEFTIEYKFDGHVVESMKSRSSRTSGSLYGEIGLNYIPLRGFGGGISLQGFQLGFHDPRFDEDYEDTVWAAGAYLRIGF